MSMRQKGVIFTELLPSFVKLLNDKKIGIQNAIRNIQAYLMDYINSYFSVPFGNQNKVLTVLKIGNSFLKLEVGCITKTKADVIVSTNSKSLNLGSGVLSKLLIQAAGNSVIDEAKNKNPNGINNNSIAITNAGNISGVKYLFHAALSHFNGEKHAIQAIESIINASFIELRSNGLTSISLPALGAGGFGYPSNFVSKQMIECITNFLKLDKNNLNVNIVLHEKETELIKIFENEFLICDKPHLKKVQSKEQKLKDSNHKISFSNLKAKGKFTIYYKSDIEYKAALSQLK
ncbi:poly [ADP-ribose] polymerase 15-like, partial [Brachionus plicatilis]